LSQSFRGIVTDQNGRECILDLSATSNEGNRPFDAAPFSGGNLTSDESFNLFREALNHWKLSAVVLSV
jgi:hypothetical protein